VRNDFKSPDSRLPFLDDYNDYASPTLKTPPRKDVSTTFRPPKVGATEKIPSSEPEYEYYYEYVYEDELIPPSPSSANPKNSETSTSSWSPAPSPTPSTAGVVKDKDELQDKWSDYDYYYDDAYTPTSGSGDGTNLQDSTDFTSLRPIITTSSTAPPPTTPTTTTTTTVSTTTSTKISFKRPEDFANMSEHPPCLDTLCNLDESNYPQ